MSHETERQKWEQQFERLQLSRFGGDSRADFAYYEMNDDGEFDRADTAIAFLRLGGRTADHW